MFRAITNSFVEVGLTNDRNKNFQKNYELLEFREAQRQVEYKAAWLGLSVIRPTKKETRGTSAKCPRCGERLQSDRE